jgi:biotin carboxyl carrier protein
VYNERVKREVIVTVDGRDRAITLDRGADGTVRVTIDGTTRVVDARSIRPGTWSVVIDGTSHVVDLDRRRAGIAASVGASEAMLQVEDALHRRLSAATQPRDKARGEILRAPIAGKVVKVTVAVGDTVAPGAAVLVLEAMKMENELVAERGGTVQAIHKQAGQAVDTGDVLVELK